MVYKRASNQGQWGPGDSLESFSNTNQSFYNSNDMEILILIPIFQGAGAAIPGGATLVFEVEMIKFQWLLWLLKYLHILVHSRKYPTRIICIPFICLFIKYYSKTVSIINIKGINKKIYWLKIHLHISCPQWPGWDWIKLQIPEIESSQGGWTAML